MKRRLLILFLLFAFVSISGEVRLTFAGPAAAEYLCEFGLVFYRQGRYDEALTEFNKALLLDPANKVAQEYIGFIVAESLPREQDRQLSILRKSSPKPITKITRAESPPAPLLEDIPRPERVLARDEIMDEVLSQYGDNKEEVTVSQPKTDTKPAAVNLSQNEKVLLSGEYRVGVGFTSDDIIWKDANADKVGVPREKNWRYLWGDERHNTYDKKIYDRFLLGMQTQFDSPFNAYMEINIDPWTFIGSTEITVPYDYGDDHVDVNLKYWSGDKRTLNETYRTWRGQIVNIPQIKVDDNKIALRSGVTWAGGGEPFATIQQTEINRQYRPVRKLWVDYTQDDYLLKVFPLSDQYEALTSDDPLRISNNHVYWEESPWLDEYEPSRMFHSDLDRPISLKGGKWIRRMSYIARDSSDDYPHRLTFLRGASFKTDTGSYSVETSIAAPMSLWDDYDSMNSLNAAARVKIPVTDV
ncbi:MAG: tetratricopeptide repeat protein, partial [Candidatus Omnitrophica bacterium]|nr:tetratricopeptide repeat protein [Candidatus Omnitrophota bacterium]